MYYDSKYHMVAIESTLAKRDCLSKAAHSVQLSLTQAQS